MWTQLFFDRSKFHTQVAEYASWPLWKKFAALLGLGVGAVSVLLQPYLIGKLTFGSEALGYSRTIFLSKEPLIYFTIVGVFEVGFAFMFYAMLKVFFSKKLQQPK